MTQAETCRYEIKAREEVLKRLQFPLKQLKNVCAKEKQKRRDTISIANDYGSYEDAHEAYGYGMITEEELDQIAEALEKGEEYVENTRTYNDYAYKILKQYVAFLDDEVQSLKWDMLSEKEKQEIAKKNAEILEKRKMR